MAPVMHAVVLIARQPFRSRDEIRDEITVMQRSGTVEGVTTREARTATADGEPVAIRGGADAGAGRAVVTRSVR